VSSSATPTHDLVVRRTFDAPVEELWKAWTDPAYVKRWWGPKGFTCPVAEMDVRVGGTSLVAMTSPEHGEHYRTWHYRAVEPNRRLEYLRRASDATGRAVDPSSVGVPPEYPDVQRHEVVLEALGDHRTLMTFTEYAWPVGEMVEISRAGLDECLDKMAAIFAAR
jgi:uncharacterized protein YndB with AHSA1/START domain